MKMLDRNRKYGTVYGDDTKCFYQDGVFFDGQGRALDAGKEAEERSEPVGEPVQVIDQDDGKAKRIAALKEMHISKVRKLAEQVADTTGVKLPKVSGAGVKNKLIKWIADHTTD